MLDIIRNWLQPTYPPLPLLLAEYEVPTNKQRLADFRQRLPEEPNNHIVRKWHVQAQPQEAANDGEGEAHPTEAADDAKRGSSLALWPLVRA
jgi:hypothetical protein